MSSLFVKSIPSVRKREFKYRGRIDSHELNAVQKECLDDILDLYNKANQMQKTMYEMNLANSIEQHSYSKRLGEAIATNNKLEEMYRNMLSPDDGFRTMTRYAYDACTEEGSVYGAVIDRNTNDITAHISGSTSKTRLYDETYDEMLVPPGLQAYIGPDSFTEGGNIYSIEDSDINNAFDGDMATSWFRKIITSTDIESIENEIVIGLPEDIITTRLVNQISIRTFPCGSMDIMDVRYKSNGAWQTVPGFKNHSCCTEQEMTDAFGNIIRYNAINNAPDLKFNFHAVQTSQVKIKMRQRDYEYDAENNRRIWYLGLRDVNIVFNVYTRDNSEFDMVFDFPETDKNIKIYDSTVCFNNTATESGSAHNVTKEYFYYDEDGNAHKIAATCPFILEGHKMMVRYSIEGTQDTPNISSCTVKYKLA